MTEVKNYIVGAHRRIKSTKWAWKDTKDEGDIYEIYSQMYRYSRRYASFYRARLGRSFT